MTAETVAEQDVVLCVGDTSFLDYGSIKVKTEGYIRFCQVNLRTPYRFDNRDPQQVYAVYAT